MQAIQDQSSMSNEFGSIIQNCVDQLNDNSSFYVLFVQRQVNAMTHRLARMSHIYTSPMYWDEPPGLILPLLLLDKMQ